MFKKLLFAVSLVALGAAAHAQGTVLWSEDFESVAAGLPAGWTQATAATDGGWKVQSTTAHSSADFPIPFREGKVLGTNDDKCNCVKANEIVYLPPMDFTGQTELRLLFDLLFVRGTYQNKTESLKLIASIDGGTTWNDVTTFTGSGSWRSYFQVNISSFAGQSDVRFGFRYDDGTGWLFGAMLDNVRVVVPDNIVRAQTINVSAGKTVSAIPALLYGYTKLLPGELITLRGTLFNSGFPTITAFDARVIYGTDTLVKNFTGLNLALGQTNTFTFAVPKPVALGNTDYSVEIFNVNGVGDNDLSDNVVVYPIEGIAPHPGRKVVVEEGTGTWCGWCPRGAVMMDYIADLYPDNVIPIAVHNSSQSKPDPMQNTVYNAGMVSMISGFPSGLVDRVNDIDPTQFEQAALVQLATLPKVLVSQNVGWDAVTRKVSVTTSLNFQEDMIGNYRIAVVYVEDNVTGTTTGYTQTNYYAGGTYGQMGGYQNLADPVPANLMVYQHVGREIVGGFSGAAGSVPSINTAGSVMSYESSYTVPPTYNIDNMHVVSMVIDQTTNRIINAESTPIPFVSTSAPALAVENIRVSIAPNPVQDEAMLTINVEETTDVQIRVVDAFGRMVAERNYGNISGKQLVPFRADNLPNGMYTLVATAKGQLVSKPFVVQR